MSLEFDLQRFDEGAEQAQPSEPQTSTESQEPIPAELDGIPEDIARETMSEWQESQAEQPEEKTSEPTVQTPETYSREDYQAKVKEAEQLKAQLANYQRQAQQPQPQFTPPPMKITPEISAKITQAINAEAMNMSGFTPDDVASLEYADNDDPRIAQWNQAKSIAQNNVLGAIRQAQINQQYQAAQFMANQQAAVNTYNELVQREMKEPDFQAIQHFATNEFFERLNPTEQKIIANSYLRVERQIASPAEMLVVKKYYEQAKAAFRGNPKNKKAPQAPPQLPRSDQLNGAAGKAEITAAELERMLDTTDFDKIPEEYQRKLLGY